MCTAVIIMQSAVTKFNKATILTLTPLEETFAIYKGLFKDKRGPQISRGQSMQF